MYPDLEQKSAADARLSRNADDDLFTMQWVKVELPEQELPGFKARGLSVKDAEKASIFVGKSYGTAKLLCRACAGESYYTPTAEPKRLEPKRSRARLISMRDSQHRRLVKMLAKNLQPDR